MGLKSVNLYSLYTSSKLKISDFREYEKILSKRDKVNSIGERFHLNQNDSMLSFLPMNHLYEISVGFMSSLNKGASIYYSHSLKPVVK